MSRTALRLSDSSWRPALGGWLIIALFFGGLGAWAGTAPLSGAVVASGVVLAYARRLLPGVDARLHASGAQTAFRFNSFIALALAERLAGPQGLAWVALLIALCVPLCNVAAVNLTNLDRLELFRLWRSTISRRR